jgi:thioredoxin-like negative regulator of GroEL
VRVLKIDADEEPVVASTLRVQGLPTVMFINDMSVVRRPRARVGVRARPA